MSKQISNIEKAIFAAEFLGGSWKSGADRYSNICVYRDDSTQDHYICTSEDEMVELYDLIHSEDSDTSRDAYSIWCSQVTHDLF